MNRAIISVLLILLLAVGAVNATSTSTQGLRGGLNLATWAGNDAAGSETLTAFHFGAFVNIKSSPQFSIQAEFLYSMKGVKASDGSLTLKFKTNYLCIPVLLKYHFPSASSTSFNMYAGPSVGLLLTANLSADDGNNSGSVDAKDAFKGTDFGLVVGLGLDIMRGETGKAVTVDFRYELGLTNILEDNFLDEGGANYDVKNSNISFGVGFTL